MRKAYLVVPTFLSIAFAAHAQQATTPAPFAKINAYGIYATSGENIVSTPGTTSGWTRRIGKFSLVEQTDRIPARMGIRFEIDYTIYGLPANQTVGFSKVVSHPPMTPPGGAEKRGYKIEDNWQTSPNGTAKGITGYGFDHDYEMVPGEWKFELWYANQKLLEKTFTVYRP